LLADSPQIPDAVTARRGGLDGLGTLPETPGEVDAHEFRGEPGGPKDLSHRELTLLRYLANNPGRIITRDELLLNVWQLNPQRVVTRTVDMHVVHLRAKLEADPKHPKLLITVRGAGYVFNGGQSR
jgi:DNA-binding response OmpR family regulator